MCLSKMDTTATGRALASCSVYLQVGSDRRNTGVLSHSGSYCKFQHQRDGCCLIRNPTILNGSKHFIPAWKIPGHSSTPRQRWKEQLKGFVLNQAHPRFRTKAQRIPSRKSEHPKPVPEQSDPCSAEPKESIWSMHRKAQSLRAKVVENYSRRI